MNNLQRFINDFKLLCQRHNISIEADEMYIHNYDEGHIDDLYRAADIREKHDHVMPVHKVVLIDSEGRYDHVFVESFEAIKVDDHTVQVDGVRMYFANTVDKIEYPNQLDVWMNRANKQGFVFQMVKGQLRSNRPSLDNIPREEALFK